jgi:hypothetical protein
MCCTFNWQTITDMRTFDESNQGLNKVIWSRDQENFLSCEKRGKVFKFIPHHGMSLRVKRFLPFISFKSNNGKKRFFLKSRDIGSEVTNWNEGEEIKVDKEQLIGETMCGFGNEGSELLSEHNLHLPDVAACLILSVVNTFVSVPWYCLVIQIQQPCC